MHRNIFFCSLALPIKVRFNILLLRIGFIDFNSYEMLVKFETFLFAPFSLAFLTIWKK